MDPDAALQNLRDAIAEAREKSAGLPDDSDLFYTVADLCEAAESLDGWLKGGGFLPKDWIR